MINNAFYGKAMENWRKHRGIKLVATEKRRNSFVSKPNYHNAEFLKENLLRTQMKNTYTHTHTNTHTHTHTHTHTRYLWIHLSIWDCQY